MNFIFLAIFISSITLLLFKDPNLVLLSITNGGQSAVTLSIKMCGLYIFWLGFMNIIEKTPLNLRLSKLLSPIVNFLFPKSKLETKGYITLNISSNLLGVGNAATPMAIKAISSMKTEKQIAASYEMIMLFVINSSSLQIFPTTILSLRVTAGSINPTSIVIPIILTSLLSTIIGIIMVKTFVKREQT